MPFIFTLLGCCPFVASRLPEDRLKGREIPGGAHLTCHQIIKLTGTFGLAKKIKTDMEVI